MATSNFPSSLDTTSALPASISETANLNSPNHADMHEVTNDAIIEIEEKLGTGDTTASTGAVLIGTGSGASAWDTSPTFVGAVTVGVNDTGHDVKFFGATDGSYMLWDESANSLHVSQQVTSSTLTDFTQALDKASIKLIGDYTEDHYQGAILWSTDDDNATKPKAGIWVKTTSSGSQLEFGTSGTHSTGITNTALSIGTDGTVTVAGELDAASLDVSGNADIDGTLETDALSINGTAVTSTAAELNILDGCTATYTELNIMDGVTATTAEINYLDNADLVAGDFTKLAAITANYDELNILDGVVATAGELNTVADVTLGTVAANKAVTVDANKDVTGFRHLTMTGDLDVDGTTDLDAVDVDGVLTVTDGSAGAPAIAFGSDTDSGFYLYSAGNVAGSAGGSRRMQFSSSGLYAIKATNNSSNYAGWSTATGYLVAKTSSIRYKENIKDIPKEEWEKIYNLQARSFDWKESAFDDNAYDANRKDDHGFIAEEVNEHLPYAVIWDKDHESSDNEYRIQSVGYGELTPYLVEAVKDLKARIETLEG